MFQIKIFSSRSTKGHLNKGSEKKNADTEPSQKKTRDKKKLLKVIVAILLVLTAIYNFVVYTSIPAIKNLRDAYIEQLCRP